jgi:hypothetical protein
LAQSRRATQLSHPALSSPIWWSPSLNQFDQVFPAPAAVRRSAPEAAEPAGNDANAALVEIIRGRTAAVGPV